MISEARVALVQMPAKQAIFNPDLKRENIDKIVAYMKSLGSKNDIVVFPELSTTGYSPFGFSGKNKVKLWQISDALNNEGDFGEILTASRDTSCLYVFGFAEKTKVKYDVCNS